MTRTVTTRVDVLRNGVKFTELNPLSAPSIYMSRTAEIKTSMSALFMADDSVNWIGDEVRPVLIIDGVEYNYGVFAAASVKTNKTDYGRTVNCELYDRCWRVQTAKTETLLHLSAGTNYISAIESLLASTGISLLISTPTAHTLTADREDWDVGTSYLTIINALLGEINYNELWFDANGYAILEPASAPDANHIDHIINADDINSLVIPAATSTLDIYSKSNVFVAICSNAELSAPLVATSVNDSPSSALSTVRRGRRIVSTVKVDNIASQAELQAYADNLRYESMLSGETITVTTAVMPDYGVGDVVALNHPVRTGICVETSWSIVLQAGGTMSHTLEKVVYI